MEINMMSSWVCKSPSINHCHHDCARWVGGRGIEAVKLTDRRDVTPLASNGYRKFPWVRFAVLVKDSQRLLR